MRLAWQTAAGDKAGEQPSKSGQQPPASRTQSGAGQGEWGKETEAADSKGTGEGFPIEAKKKNKQETRKNQVRIESILLLFLSYISLYC